MINNYYSHVLSGLYSIESSLEETLSDQPNLTVSEKETILDNAIKNAEKLVSAYFLEKAKLSYWDQLLSPSETNLNLGFTRIVNFKTPHGLPIGFHSFLLEAINHLKISDIKSVARVNRHAKKINPHPYMKLAKEFNFEGSSRYEAYNYLNRKFFNVRALCRLHPNLITEQNNGVDDYVIQDLRRLNISQIFDLFANETIYSDTSSFNAIIPFIMKHAKLKLSNKNEYDEETRINGTLALDHAVKHGAPKITKFLLELGASPNKIKPNLNNPIHFAARNTPKQIPILLEYGADINALSFNQETALHLAILWKDLSTLKLLLENKADPNILYENKITSLRLATSQKWKEGIKLLKAYNAY